MFQRSGMLIKGVCFVAGAVLLYQASHLVLRGDPLAKVKIPQLPSLTNSPSSTNLSRPPSPISHPTNVAAQVGSTNALASGTNHGTGSNSISGPSLAAGTNNVATSNRVAYVLAAIGSTNATNRTLTAGSIGTVPPRPGGKVMGMPGMGPGGPRGPAPPLPKPIQARVDRITDSELLAPAMRPLPMALLGIAGEHVFLRAANGQTGLVKIGDTLGGIKLLKIGINRVLIEEDGQNKELTIFSGMGGESLMPAAKTNL